MPRLTASLSDAQYEHVEELADELDASLAEVMRRLIDAHRRGDVKSDALLKGKSDVPVHHEVMHEMSDAQEKIRELENRIDELEADVEELAEEIGDQSEDE